MVGLDQNITAVHQSVAREKLFVIGHWTFHQRRFILTKDLHLHAYKIQLTQTMHIKDSSPTACECRFKEQNHVQ